MTRTGLDTEEPDEEPEELAVWLSAGFERAEAENWRRWRFTIARAREWQQQGVDDGLEAAQWQTAGVSVETVIHWRAASVAAGEAAHWRELGFSLEQVRIHKRHGRGPMDAFRLINAQSMNVRQAGAGRWVGIAPAGPSAQAFIAGGTVGSPVHRFQQSGVDPRLMHGFMRCGWMDEDAVEWARNGIEAQDAYLWFDLGLKAVEAGRLVVEGRTPGDLVREWWDTGIPFEEVADWIGAGLTATEAFEQRANGVTVEQAAALRALRLEDPQPAPPASTPHGMSPRRGAPRTQVFGPPPEDEDSAQASIVEAFANMLDADETGNVRAVEGGSNLGQCLAEARDWHGITENHPAPGATVTADVVRFVNEHEARVLFTIRVGAPVNQTFGGRSGRATLVEGEWRVARETFCEFMQMAGVQCPPP
jgi:hypothetical protein